jgi:hypothetical protein
MLAKRGNVLSGIFCLHDPTEDTTTANLVAMMKNYDAGVYAAAVAETDRTSVIEKVYLFDKTMEYTKDTVKNLKKDFNDLTSAGIQKALEAHAPNCTLSHETVGNEKHIKMTYPVDDGEAPAAVAAEAAAAEQPPAAGAADAAALQTIIDEHATTITEHATTITELTAAKNTAIAAITEKDTEIEALKEKLVEEKKMTDEMFSELSANLRTQAKKRRREDKDAIQLHKNLKISRKSRRHTGNGHASDASSSDDDSSGSENDNSGIAASDEDEDEEEDDNSGIAASEEDDEEAE